MGEVKKKYIGHSALKGKPSKHLLFKLADKTVTLSKLADDVFVNIRGLISQSHDTILLEAKTYADTKNSETISIFNGEIQQVKDTVSDINGSIIQINTTVENLSKSFSDDSKALHKEIATVSDKVSLLEECCTVCKEEINLLKDKYVTLSNDITANRQSIALLTILYRNTQASIASILEEIEDIKKHLPDVDPPFDSGHFYIGSGTKYTDIADDKYAHLFTGRFTGTYTANIEADNHRLYIVIPKEQRSKIIKTDILGREVAGITMSGFDIPFVEMGVGNFIVFTSANTYVAGEYDIKIQ